MTGLSEGILGYTSRPQQYTTATAAVLDWTIAVAYVFLRGHDCSVDIILWLWQAFLREPWAAAVTTAVVVLLVLHKYVSDMCCCVPCAIFVWYFVRVFAVPRRLASSSPATAAAAATAADAIFLMPVRLTPFSTCQVYLRKNDLLRVQVVCLRGSYRGMGSSYWYGDNDAIRRRPELSGESIKVGKISRLITSRYVPLAN